MTAIAMAYDEGVFASRPAASVGNGYVYFATDTGNLYRSNGSAWTQIATLTTGGAPSGAAGGDLTGTYPNPTLAAAGGGAAGPIGNATTIPVVTVDAKGRVTALSSIGVGGGGTGIGAILFDSTLGADTASIDTGAAGIAGGYNVLEIWIVSRTDDAGATGTILVTFNNDTGANYDRQVLAGSNATASAGFGAAAANWPINTHGSGGTASYATVTQIVIPAYTQTSFFKSATFLNVTSDNTSTNNSVITWAAGYRSTTAISRMKVAASGAAKLKAGSRLLIYGR